MLYKSIEGHSVQRALLRRIFFAGRLPPAILLAGESGIGKRQVAYELTHTIFCEKCRGAAETGANPGFQAELYGGCGSCKTCALVSARNMPDFYELNCEDRAQANVEGVRDLLYSLNLKPFAGQCRVVFFDNAEYLNIQSANALLKAIEEPRPSTYYILTCANPHKLPDTVLSRCQTFHFDSLSSEQVKAILTANRTLDSAEADLDISLDELCLIADGSLENMKEPEEGVRGWRECQNNLISISAGSTPLALEYASDLSKDKLTLRAKLRLIRSFARYQLQQKQGVGECTSWGRLLLDIVTSERLIFERNLAPMNVLSVIFLRLAEGADKNDTFIEEQILGL